MGKLTFHQVKALPPQVIVDSTLVSSGAGAGPFVLPANYGGIITAAKPTIADALETLKANGLRPTGVHALGYDHEAQLHKYGLVVGVAPEHLQLGAINPIDTIFAWFKSKGMTD